MEILKVKLKCDALIDQNRYIGEDPVGYACSNEAAYETSWIDGAPILLCESCSKLLLTDLERLTFYTPFTGKKYQLDRVKDILKSYG